jgi:hypothetical protein
MSVVPFLIFDFAQHGYKQKMHRLTTIQFNSIQFNFIQNPFDPDTGCNVQAIDID